MLAKNLSADQGPFKINALFTSGYSTPLLDVLSESVNKPGASLVLDVNSVTNHE